MFPRTHSWFECLIVIQDGFAGPNGLIPGEDLWISPNSRTLTHLAS
jgi:hypothetical protein